MARRVFFSFHFERDNWRVGQVRNCWLTKPNRESAGYWDATKWEEIKKQGEEAIKKWINDSLDNTSVTCVLIGSETSSREWVKYEIKKSHERGNGILGIYIHKIKNSQGLIDIIGNNPFDDFYITQQNGQKKYLSQIYSTFDWINDNGYNNLGVWIEQAAKEAGK